MRWGRRTDGQVTVHRISGVRPSLTEDVSRRQRQYLLAMSVRTVCFVLAVLCGGVLRWVMFAGALLLPYIAVVLANRGRQRATGAPATAFTPVPRTALEAGAVDPADQPGSGHD